MIPSIYLLYATVGFAIAGIGTLAIGKKRQNNNPKPNPDPQQTEETFRKNFEAKIPTSPINPVPTIPQEALEFETETPTETAITTTKKKQQPPKEKFDVKNELGRLLIDKLRSGEWQPEITLVEDGRKSGLDIGLGQKIDLKITARKEEPIPEIKLPEEAATSEPTGEE